MTALSDCLTNLHSEAGGAVELIILRPVDAPDLVAHALAGDRQAIRIFEALSNASRAVQNAPKRKPLLCATCPRPLRGTAFTFGIVLPMRDDPQSGVAFGICVKCGASAEVLQAKATAALHNIWPDLVPVDITHPEGGRA